jgi:hypothetical protein
MNFATRWLIVTPERQATGYSKDPLLSHLTSDFEG